MAKANVMFLISESIQSISSGLTVDYLYVTADESYKSGKLIK